MNRNIFSWIIEVNVPFHHRMLSRWKVVMIDASTGRQIVEDWTFDTKEAADNAMDCWVKTHPGDFVRQIVPTTDTQVMPGVRRGDHMLSPFYYGDDDAFNR